MTRDADRSVGRRDRLEIARKSQGELFISLHADSLLSAPEVSGASVYTLSESALNDEPAHLASKDDRDDILARIDVPNKEDSWLKLCRSELDVSTTGKPLTPDIRLRFDRCRLPSGPAMGRPRSAGRHPTRTLKRRGGRKLIPTPEGAMPTPKPRPDETLGKAQIWAHGWRRRIESVQAKSITHLAEQEGVTVAYVPSLSSRSSVAAHAALWVESRPRHQELTLV
jgi:N-acetylmuramoyl-L-alanine amidase